MFAASQALLSAGDGVCKLWFVGTVAARPLLRVWGQREETSLKIEVLLDTPLTDCHYLRFFFFMNPEDGINA